MDWLRRIIHRILGPTRYHDQANEVNVRALRAELLRKQVQVVTRRHQQ